MTGVPTVQFVVVSDCAFEADAGAWSSMFGQPHDDVDRLRAEMTMFFHKAKHDHMVDLERATLFVVPGGMTDKGFRPDPRWKPWPA